VTISKPDSLSSCKIRDYFRNKKEEEKFTHLNELDVRKPLVESILQRSKELRLYNQV
jgi:hypothetical protein